MSSLNTHNSVKKNIGSTIVSMSLAKSGLKLKPLVSPALWIHDYAKHGKQPDVGDYSIFFGGYISGRQD